MKTEENPADTLVQHIGRLNAESARRRVKTRAVKQERDDALAQRDAIRAQFEEVSRERDMFRQKLDSEPNDLILEIERLKGELRIRDHKDVFKKVATDAEARPEAIEDLWRLSGYVPQSDEIDPNQIRELVEEAKSAKPYLFQSKPADAGKNEGQPAARPPGPGFSRGVPDSTSGGMAVRKAQLRDPNWMRYNQAAIAEASKKGSLTILPD
jgi:hypothetical protein